MSIKDKAGDVRTGQLAVSGRAALGKLLRGNCSAGCTASGQLPRPMSGSDPLDVVRARNRGRRAPGLRADPPRPDDRLTFASTTGRRARGVDLPANTGHRLPRAGLRGDTHLSNFGGSTAPDALVLDINDFDETIRGRGSGT